MIIELYGLPASGKTTLAKKIADSANFKIIKIRRKSELIFYNLLYFIKHPIKFFATLAYLAKNFKTFKIFYLKFMNAFLHCNAKYQKAMRCENAILDQGYFQNVISVFEKPLLPSMLRQYVKYLLYPDKLFVFDINYNKMIDRVNQRGYFAREEFSKNYKEKWQKVIEHNDKVLKQNLKNIAVDYFIINEDNNFEEICKKYEQQ